MNGRKMRIYLYILLLIWTVGCKQGDKVQTENNGVDTIAIVDSMKNFESQDYEGEYEESITISSEALDQFANSPFINASISNLRTLNYSSIDTSLKQNRHVQNQVDTIFNFHFDQSNIKIYKLPEKELIINSTFKKNVLPLKRGIKIGDHKKEIFQKLSLSDTLTISDDILRIQVLEVTQYIDLKFKNDTLQKIEFKGYVD